MSTVLWAVTWRYGDKSAWGIVRIYSSEKKAQADVEMLKKHCVDKGFGIEPVEWVNE